MIAFGNGELSGLINGLAIGSSFIHLLFQFKFFIFGLILLYGVVFWGNVFTRSDALKTFADFLRVGFWFFYVVLIFTLFTYKYEGKITYIPTKLDIAQLNEGLQVVTPGGKKKLVEAKNGTETIRFEAPTVFGLLDVLDSPVYLAAYYLTVVSDPIKWGGYIGNDISPSKVFDKCFSKAISEAPTTQAAFNTICYFLPHSSVSLYFFQVNWGWSSEISGLCSSLRAGSGGPDQTVINTYKDCVGKTLDAVIKNVEVHEQEVRKLYDSGKISDEEFKKSEEEIKETKDKIHKVYDHLYKDYETTWKAALAELLKKHPEAFKDLKAVEDSSSITKSTIRAVIEKFSEIVSQAFVGQDTLLYYTEAVTKFMLSLEVGIAFPLLLLLSMFPEERGVFPFRVSSALLAAFSYMLIRLIRIAVFLLFLIAHNYFLANSF